MRSLAIGLLALSLVGGYWLGTGRQAQQRTAALEDGQRDARDDLYQLKLDAAAQWRATAAQRAAQADAKAKPPTKYAKYGADYLTNPVPQIRWGLSYIKGRYGDACGAWGHSQRYGWY